MIDPKLEAYKKTTIAKLNAVFVSAVNALKSQLNANIDFINKQPISKKNKINAIAICVSKYNSSINALKTKLASDIRTINLLTIIPGTITIPATTTSNKYALLIGINYRNTSNQLEGCINDATNIKKLLEEQYAFKNFTMLTDDTTKKPTKKNILDEFTNLLKNSNNGDSVVFTYSGHGSSISDLTGDEMDKRDELIFTIDSQYVLDDELNKIIKNNLKPGVKLFAMFDACFSGTILDLKYNYLDSDNNNNSTTNPNVLETSGQVIMISGCTDKQTSADASINTNGTYVATGAMTFCFLSAIQKLGTNPTLNNLIQDMRGTLKQHGFTQLPQLSSGKSININTTTIKSFI
jgi:hypothetical protein